MLYVNYITIKKKKTLGKARKWSIQKSPECCSLGKKTRCKIVVVQRLSHVSWWLFTTLLWPHGLQHARLPCPSPSPGVCSNSCPLSQWWHPTISSSSPASPPALSLSQHQGLFQCVLYIRWPKYWSFSFSISLSKEYSGLISFRIDWFDLLAVQVTLKNLLQHHSLKASILGPSGFSTVQLSHPYMTTGKTIALTRRTFVSRVISLLFNTLSRFVIAFPPRNKHFLIAWLQSLSWVIVEPKKIKSVTVSIFSPIHLPWSGGTECHGLSFSDVEF